MVEFNAAANFNSFHNLMKSLKEATTFHIHSHSSSVAFTGSESLCLMDKAVDDCCEAKH